jgi:hypothetical protein
MEVAMTRTCAMAGNGYHQFASAEYTELTLSRGVYSRPAGQPSALQKKGRFRKEALQENGTSEKSGAQVKPVSRETQRSEQPEAAEYCDGFQNFHFYRRGRERERHHSGYRSHCILKSLAPMVGLARKHKVQGNLNRG